MFSLDVVQWRRRRSEADGARSKGRAGSPLPRVDQQDRRAKHIYGKTTQEMHEAYLERVGQWVKAAPAHEWGKDYAKENYSRAYMPRVRRKELEHGGPNVKIGAYSPRGVYKGGGKCVKHLVDPRAPAVVDPRSEQSGVPMHDEYRERVVNVEKTREKHKEIQPPMAIPANKPLSCGKFFVSDVISAGSSSPNHTEVETAGARRCPANCPPSPTLKDREEGADEHEDVYERLYQPPRASTAAAEPPSTAEYVKSPRWREPNRRKWVAGSFVTTVASTNVHTAQQRRIDGSASGPTLLIEDKFASTYENPCASPASPAVRAFEHQRRAKTAAALAQRPLKRMSKKYFVSMWTEPPSDSPADSQSPKSPSRNPGRQLVDSLRSKQASPRRGQKD